MIRMRGYVSQGRARLSPSRFAVKVDVPFAGGRKWLLSLLATTAISILLLLTNVSVGFLKSRHPLFASQRLIEFEHKELPVSTRDLLALPAPPKLAYLISGTKGDGYRMQRTLQVLYHPHNYYLLHLDRECPRREREELARYVRDEPVFAKVQNVFVVAKANLVTYRGPTMIAATLHGAAILLRKAKDWDWFINLSASDYPLVTQDDMLHVFSYLPKDLNFIEHSSDSWKEVERAKPIVIDPGLYEERKSDIFLGVEQRTIPTIFRLFTGSAWAVITRGFLEYCNYGWENLPRLLLLYYANFVSSPEGYFHTVICNSPEFRNTTVNHDLHFIAWDWPANQHPLTLTLDVFPDLVTSGCAFARKFLQDDPVLDRIDNDLLHRKPGQFVPGGWCVGSDAQDPCAVIGDARVLKPGPGARRLEELVTKLLAPDHFRSHQCVAS